MENVLNPSILSADFSNLGRALSELENNGIRNIHIDVMDGQFVPNITFGPSQIACIRRVSKLYFDCHLMIDEPIRFIDDFVKSGVDSITVHVESTKDIHKTLESIKCKNVGVGISLNPDTSLDSLENLLHVCDKILIMSVNPGFGGQKFIDSIYDKIYCLKDMLCKYGFDDKIIQVDGGINKDNIKKVYDLGARDIVVGSSIFNNESIKNNIKVLIDKLNE